MTAGVAVSILQVGIAAAFGLAVGNRDTHGAALSQFLQHDFLAGILHIAVIAVQAGNGGAEGPVAEGIAAGSVIFGGIGQCFGDDVQLRIPAVQHDRDGGGAAHAAADLGTAGLAIAGSGVELLGGDFIQRSFGVLCLHSAAGKGHSDLTHFGRGHVRSAAGQNDLHLDSVGQGTVLNGKDVSADLGQGTILVGSSAAADVGAVSTPGHVVGPLAVYASAGPDFDPAAVIHAGAPACDALGPVVGFINRRFKDTFGSAGGQFQGAVANGGINDQIG